MFPLFASLALYFHQFIAPWTSIKGYFYNYFTFHCCWSLLFVCLPLSLSVSIIWYDYISIICRCILSPKTNTKRRSICYNKQNLISNFRYVYEYYRQLHKPMFFLLELLSFDDFISWWSKLICLCWSCGTQKSKGCSERKLRGHRSSNFSASPCGPRVTSSWTPVFGCQVVFFC